MTAHAMAGERERCLSRGMNGYISKPVNEDELFKLISGFGLKENKNNELKIQEIIPVYQYIDLNYMKSVSNGDQDFERTVTKQF